MKSIHDVAKKAGVSTATVSRFLNNSGYVGAAARERITQAIADLDYVPNSLARSLHSKTTQTIGLLLPDISNVFWTSVARGVEDEARQAGYNVILCNTDSSWIKLEEYTAVLLQKQVDGMIFVPLSAHKPDLHKFYQTFMRQGVPCVFLDAPVPGVNADAVLVDSQAGALALTELMISMGHRRIALLTGDPGYYTSEERLAGYLKALQKANIQPDPALIRYTTYDASYGHHVTLELLQLAEPPSAIFAGNVMVALGVIEAVREAGLNIPQNISLVCFDDIPQASLIDPFLTVASQPAYLIGQTGAQMLLERIQGQGPSGPRTIVLPVEIIQRRSCIPLKTK